MSWSRLLRAVALPIALLLQVLSAHADAKRVALILANSDYGVAPLANPVRDGTALAKVLESLAFDVTFEANADFTRMKAALSDIAQKAATAEIAIVYFAGHGTERDGRNYLIPVDAKLDRASDLDLQAVALTTVLDQVAAASKLKIVILDACRNNVFPLAGTKRATPRGLARVEPDDNTLVVYSAKEGTTAEDGDGADHSPFAASLLRNLPTEGLEVNFIFRRIRDDVVRATNGAQQPFTYGSLGGEPIFLLAARDPAPSPAPAPSPELDLSKPATLEPPPASAEFHASIRDRSDALSREASAMQDLSEAHRKREEAAGGTCGTKSRAHLKSRVAFDKEILSKWVAMEHTHLASLRRLSSERRPIMAKGGPFPSEIEEGPPWTAEEVINLVKYSNELGEEYAASFRKLAQQASIPPGKPGFTCYDPDLAAALTQLAKSAETKVEPPPLASSR